MTFEEAWQQMLDEGYQCGETTRTFAELGWKMAVLAMKQAPQYNLEIVSTNPWEPWREMVRAYNEGEWVSVEDLPV